MTARRFPALTAALLALVLVACQGGGDAQDDTARADTAGAAGAAGAAGTAGAAGATADTGAMLDPNTATREQLVAIGGMTAAAADTLVARRPYSSMTAVDSVLAPQLDSAQRRTVYARLWTPIDLNKASDAEILLIPGVGARMLREFKEYRPYTSVEQFRREIGKYVDNNEVARFEKYILIK